MPHTDTNDTLERLIQSVSDFGIPGILATLHAKLGAESVVFALGGARIAAKPERRTWDYATVLDIGACKLHDDSLMVFPLQADDTVLGFFAVRSPEQHRFVLSAAVNLITIELRRLRAKDEGERTVVYNVLDDIVRQTSTAGDIQSRLGTLGLEPDAEVQVLVGVCRAPAQRLSNIPWEIYAATSTLDAPLLRSHYNGAMVMIIPNPSVADEVARHLLGRLEELSSPASVGISAVASVSASGIRAAYFQALAASSNGPGLQRPGVLDMAALLAQNRAPAAVVAAARELLAPLTRHDRVNQTELLATLRAFLQCNRKVSDVAERFFMHRNTIRYRLNQIEQILGVDLEATRDLVNLAMAVQLNDLHP